MRKIKFRIYFKDEERFMSKPITLEDLLHEDWIAFENEEGTLSLPLKDFNFFYSKNENYEIMQYTGLKDRKGKEIYVGDIIYWESAKKNYKVIFVDGGYCLDTPGFATDLYRCSDSKGNHLKIVGNIYDNKELLGE